MRSRKGFLKGREHHQRRRKFARAAGRWIAAYSTAVNGILTVNGIQRRAAIRSIAVQMHNTMIQELILKPMVAAVENYDDRITVYRQSGA